MGSTIEVKFKRLCQGNRAAPAGWAVISITIINSHMIKAFEEWENRWKQEKEDTSSSMSGLHFGHYKAGDQSQIISHFHALKTSLILCRGITLERWSHGLLVMLENMFGCSLVTKLCSILMIELDFNFANKTIYGGRMLDNVRK